MINTTDTLLRTTGAHAVDSFFPACAGLIGAAIGAGAALAALGDASAHLTTLTFVLGLGIGFRFAYGAVTAAQVLFRR